jgi:hypothetical protein
MGLSGHNLRGVRQSRPTQQAIIPLNGPFTVAVPVYHLAVRLAAEL